MVQGRKKKKAMARGAKSNELNLLKVFPDYQKQAYIKKVSSDSKDCLNKLREDYLRSGIVLYIGAGVSLSVGLPSWAELIRNLTVSMMSRKAESAIITLRNIDYTDDNYWNLLSSVQDEISQSADYRKPILMMARAIKQELGGRLPYLIARTLYRHQQFRLWDIRRDGERSRKKLKDTSNSEELPTSPLLDSLVALARAERDVKGVQAIVNYNYDDILDEKLREQNVRCKTVRSGRDVVPSGFLPCYHVHGVLPIRNLYIRADAYTKDKIGNFVFSEDEYHQEYSDPYRWSNMIQISLLGKNVGLFVGLSMQDPNIRRLIDVTYRQYPENKNYAVLKRESSLYKAKDQKGVMLRNLYEEVESRSFESIGVKVIWVDSFEEMPEFINSICS